MNIAYSGLHNVQVIKTGLCPRAHVPTCPRAHFMKISLLESVSLHVSSKFSRYKCTENKHSCDKRGCLRTVLKA